MAGKIRPEQLGTAAAITSLLNAADAAAARTVLGLGTLATKATAGYADLSVTVGGRNLLPNSSFEQGLTGWTPSVVTATASSTQVLVGALSAKLTTAAPDWNTWIRATVTAKPLTTYTVTAWLYVESIAGDAYLGRDVTAIDGGDASNWAAGSSLTTSHPVGVWTRKTVRITTSAASTSISVYLYCPNGAVYWDCVQVEEGDVPTSWAPAMNEGQKLIPYPETQAAPADGTAWVELEEGMGQGFISSVGPGSIGTTYEQNARVRARIGGVDFYATMEKA